MTQCLRARRVEPQDTAIVRQHLGKHVPVAIDIHTKTGNVGKCFLFSLSESYITNTNWAQTVQFIIQTGQRYQVVVVSQLKSSRTEKYGHESHRA
jgi:hypothetical protein